MVVGRPSGVLVTSMISIEIDMLVYRLFRTCMLTPARESARAINSNHVVLHVSATISGLIVVA